MEPLVTTLINELAGYRNILDVGVGTGRFAKPFLDQKLNIVGVDIARRMLKKSNRERRQESTAN
jgi:predicted TPR repeat methyltransferase